MDVAAMINDVECRRRQETVTLKTKVSGKVRLYIADKRTETAVRN